jgi:hypothetical protein
LINHEIPRYEGEFISYFPSHPEAIDEYCLFLSNLYESAKQTREYEVQRLVYRYLKNHRIVLEELFRMVLDGIELWTRPPEVFLEPKFDDQMSKNLLGDICSIFTKAFKLAVVKRDKEAVEIMIKMMRLYDQVLEDLIRGLIPEVLGVDDDIRKEVRMSESVLNSKLYDKKGDQMNNHST